MERAAKPLLRIDDPEVRARLERNALIVKGSLPTYCWVYMGWKDPDKGYGKMSVDGKSQWTHRVSYAVYKGDIPAGVTVDHECHNPGCFNPGHLELLPFLENSVLKKGKRHVRDHGSQCEPGSPRSDAAAEPELPRGTA